MNKKLIAAAVAASVVAPVASYGGDVTVYGNITNALVLNDDGENDSTTNVDTVSSRLGVKASSDIGGNMTAHGRYEFATQSDNAGDAFGTTRIATVGFSGDFGTFNVGQQWSTFYNKIGSFVSPNYTVGVPLGGYFRTGNTLKYTNNFGPIDLGVDIRIDDNSDDLDPDEREAQGNGFGIGAVFNPADNISVGVAYDTSNGAETALAPTPSDGTATGTAGREDEADRTILGVAVKATFGNFWGSIGYQAEETDEVDAIAEVDGGTAGDFADTAGDHPGTTGVEKIESNYFQVWVGTTVNERTSLTLGYGKKETEQEGAEDTEDDRLAFAVNHDLGGGLHFFLEHQTGETAAEVDQDKTFLGMRINF